MGLCATLATKAGCPIQKESNAAGYTILPNEAKDSPIPSSCGTAYTRMAMFLPPKNNATNQNTTDKGGGVYIDILAFQWVLEPSSHGAQS